MEISKLKQFLKIILITVIITISSICLSSCGQKKEVPRVKSPPQAKKELPSIWYVRFSVKDQRSTAYTEESGAPKAANGQPYFLGGIAVHPRYPINDGGSPLQPILPFGTVIFLETPVTIQGQEYDSLTVMDTGDVYYGLWPNYPYWIDIFHGTSNYYNVKEARDYGIPLTNYYWYEEWK